MKKAFFILFAFLLLALASHATAQPTHALSHQGASLSPAMNTVDADEDGLDDAVEQQLIDRFRPYYFFDHANDKWAASVLWFVSRSELYYRSSPTAPRVRIYTRQQLAENPGLVLQVQVPGEPSSNAAISLNTDKYFIDPRSSQDANGEGPCVDVGCYAHVMPIMLPQQPNSHYPRVDNNPNPHPAILIQFFQFFPYNDSQSSLGGDHEGDWVKMDIYVKPELPYSLIGVVYHHHGDDTCTPTLVKSLSSPPKNFLNCGAFSNSIAPMCFLEEDNHEWWPWPGDNECEYFPGIYNDRHDGKGVRYRVRNVINLGERFAPSDNLEAQVAMLFNGKWGNDDDGDFFEGEAPKGITDKSEHFFPPIPKLVVAYVQPGAEAWPHDGAGSRYHPYDNIDAAVDGLRSNGTIRLNAGSYPKPKVLGGPGVNLRIEAIGGSVVIGQ